MIATLVCGQSAYGHMLNMTNIDVQVDAQHQASVTVEIDLGQSLMSAETYWAATQLPKDRQQLSIQSVLDRLDRDLRFLVDGQEQSRQLTGFEIGATSLDAIQNPLTPQMATLYYKLDVSGAQRLNVELADQLDIPWPCLVKIQVAGQKLPHSRLLTDVDRLSRDTFLSETFGNTERDARGQLLSGWAELAPEVTWVAVGFQHIVPKGLDHMLFILGLFFLAGGWRPLLIQVTGFTIAHSITLGLSMYGIINVSPSIVEPLIALSIVYVAIDNLFATQLAKWRIGVVCMFGLLHGLGFASVLANIGLPQDQFLLGLGLFNIGVELGQLTVIAAAFLIVGWFRRQAWYQSAIAQPATIAIAGTGAYWFLKRIAFS
tara:strand:+ start:261 stop:1382 length:1122 start_codon:yes stop_codon:yes gene_type:complete